MNRFMSSPRFLRRTVNNHRGVCEDVVTGLFVCIEIGLVVPSPIATAQGRLGLRPTTPISNPCHPKSFCSPDIRRLR